MASILRCVRKIFVVVGTRSIRAWPHSRSQQTESAAFGEVVAKQDLNVVFKTQTPTRNKPQREVATCEHTVLVCALGTGGTSCREGLYSIPSRTPSICAYAKSEKADDERNSGNICSKLGNDSPAWFYSCWNSQRKPASVTITT